MQDLNAKVAALVTKAEALAKPDGWSPVTSTSSSDKVVVTTGAGATATSLLVLGRLDRQGAHALVQHQGRPSATRSPVPAPRSWSTSSTATAPRSSRPATAPCPGSSTPSTPPARGSAPRTVNLGDGTHRLRIESSTTGAASSFARHRARRHRDPRRLRAHRHRRGRLDPDRQRPRSRRRATPSPTCCPGSASPWPPTPRPATVDHRARHRRHEDVDLGEGAGGRDQRRPQPTSTRPPSRGIGGAKAGPLAGDSMLRGVRDQLLGTLYSTTGGSLMSRRHRARQVRQAHLRRGAVQEGLRGGPGHHRGVLHQGGDAPPGSPTGWRPPPRPRATRTTASSPAASRAARRTIERLAGLHRQLGHQAGAAAYDAHPPVHRPRDGAEPDEQPVQLARRPDLVPQLQPS